MILWAHTRHTNYIAFICTEFSFRAEAFSKSHMVGLNSDNSVDHLFTFTFFIEQMQAINSFDAIQSYYLVEFSHPHSAFSSCQHGKGKTIMIKCPTTKDKPLIFLFIYY